MRLNTFDEVANWFDKTVPIRGQRAAQVIRPIGQRNRSWERIEKVDENCYFLTDGWGSWTTRNLTPTQRTERTSYYTAMAPILWERREDGEYVRIRNCPNGSGSPSRFNFTRWNLPEGLSFSWGDKDHKSGKHYITAKGVDGHEKFFLPKFSVRDANGQADGDTGQMLWFKRVGNGVWQRVGEIMGEPVKRLNKAVTQEYKQAINEFYSFMGAVVPALGFMNSDARTVYWQMLNDNPTERYYWGRKLSTQLNRPEVVREVLRTEDHSLRVALAVMVAYELDVYAQSGTYRLNPETGKSDWVSHEYVRLPENAEQAKAMRRSYINIIRKAGDMFETVYK